MKQRILTSLVALPLLICLVVWGSVGIFGTVVLVAIFLAQLEFNQMGLGQRHKFQQVIAALVGASIIPLLLYASAQMLFPWLTSAFILIALTYLFKFQSLEDLHKDLGWTALGLVYVPVLLGHMFLLRLEPYGKHWIFLLLMAVMLCDTFAYFFGMKFGKHKLYPTVSPNKSVEGAFAGLIGAVVAVFIAKAIFLPVIGIIDGIAIGLILGVFGQVGDLFESLLKRSCGVKDSGALIPGHGGMLDRLDSLLFAFPVMYYVVSYCYGG